MSTTTTNQTGFICHVPSRTASHQPFHNNPPPRAVCFGKSEGCFGLRTTVELLRSQRRHRSALQAAGVVAGGRSLSVARLGVLLEEVGQPQQLTVAVQRVGIQSPTHTHTRICTSKKKELWKRWADNVLAALCKNSLAVCELKVGWHGRAQSKQWGSSGVTLEDTLLMPWETICALASFSDDWSHSQAFINDVAFRQFHQQFYPVQWKSLGWTNPI